MARIIEHALRLTIVLTIIVFTCYLMFVSYKYMQDAKEKYCMLVSIKYELYTDIRNKKLKDISYYLDREQYINDDLVRTIALLQYGDKNPEDIYNYINRYAKLEKDYKIISTKKARCDKWL